MEDHPQRVDPRRTRRLLEVARALASDVGLDAVLQRVLEAAAALTDARYAALGVIDESGEGLERFLTLGVNDRTRDRIGDLPRGHGVLGELIRHPKPIRLADIGSHPRSFGFPLGHPAMTTFLGVPILVAGRPYGNLYLTDKLGGGEFDRADEDAVVALAGLAGVTIQKARIYEALTERNAELERVTRGLEATTEIARAIGGTTDLDVVLDLVVKRSRALVAARAGLALLRDGDDLVVAAAAGELRGDVRGTRIGDGAQAPNMSGPDGARAVACTAMPEALRAVVPGATALIAPLHHRGRTVGALVVCEALGESREFHADDHEALTAVAAIAAIAVSSAQAATERERALESAAQLAAIVQGSDDAIYSRDHDGRLTSWNPGAERLFGWARDEALGRTAHFLAPPGHEADIENLFARVLRGEQVENIETERARRDGSLVPVSITVSAIRDADGSIRGASTIARDISQRKRYEQELRRLAETDPLTGLHNRRRFFLELERLLTYLHRYRRPGAVLMIDLDNLKDVNDTLGHEAGDALLTEVGRVLTGHARSSDLVARLGGDEFVMALPEVDAAGARLAADRLISALRADIREVSGRSVTTTASVGLAAFDGADEVRADDIVRRADEAMYLAKRAGRDRLVQHPADGVSARSASPRSRTRSAD